MQSNNFVLLTALQLSGGVKPKQWQYKYGLNLLNRYINQRKLFGLDTTGMMDEYREAFREIKGK
ncbi:hypothetical protein WNY63_16760 [Pseudoalteromonas neustonica]|uniref:Uncharacterized protein n=1 Tax=Pseudoalteromonas neustonica TaxID=1840331 RepID=A0ABU9U5R6_9GAMM